MEQRLNISFNRNKVAKIGNNAQSYVSGNYIIQVGKPLGTFYGTVTDGILQTGEETQKGKFTGNATPKAGDRLYKDINGDGTFTTAADRTIIGNAQPDFIFGFINTFSWRGFDLSVFLQGTYGNQIINSNRQTLEMFTGQQNASVIALERWTSQNPSATIPGRNWILHLSSPTGLLKMVPFACKRRNPRLRASGFLAGQDPYLGCEFLCYSTKPAHVYPVHRV